MGLFVLYIPARGGGSKRFGKNEQVEFEIESIKEAVIADQISPEMARIMTTNLEKYKRSKLDNIILKHWDKRTKKWIELNLEDEETHLVVEDYDRDFNDPPPTN